MSNLFSQESSSASDRKAQALSFILTSEQLTKLQTPKSVVSLPSFVCIILTYTGVVRGISCAYFVLLHLGTLLIALDLEQNSLVLLSFLQHAKSESMVFRLLLI